MIQLIIVVLGLMILGSIFIRRYMMVERGISSFSFFGRKRGVLDILHFHRFQDQAALEVTVEEMIPERKSIDIKKVAKADTLIKKADAALAKNDMLMGEKLLIQSLSLDPSNTETYHKLGLLYLRQSQFGKAEMMYHKLISSSVSDPVYYSNLAVAMYQQQKLADAKINYQKAIELDASRAGRFFSLAQVLKELGEVESSLKHFRKAIEMEPANLDYLLSLSQTYIDLKMMSEARILLGEILAAYPDNEIAKEMMQKVTKEEETPKRVDQVEEEKTGNSKSE